MGQCKVRRVADDDNLCDEYLGIRGEILWDVGFSVGAIGYSYWGEFSYDLLKVTEVFWDIGCREEFSRDDQRIAVNHFGC